MTSASDFRPGDLVAGRYRIDGALGAGGFGAVFRATQLPVAGDRFQGVGRPVALKVLHAHVLGDAEGLERFRREVIVLQRLSHPNIVRVHDFGEAEARVPFIVFELLEGKSLDALVREQGPLPEGRVVRVVTQVLKALMEAHDAGIVHRDIKPANILVTDFSGERDFVKVLDFGVAKATRSMSLVDLTRRGQVVGTPHYLAPEAIRGETPTPAADLYAVGLTMIRVMTGAPLFSGPIAQILQQQLSAEPIALPAVVTRSPLAHVIRRATQKNLSLRYASAEEMLAELERASAAAHPRTVELPTHKMAAPAVDFGSAHTTNAPFRPAPLQVPGTSYAVAPPPNVPFESGAPPGAPAPMPVAAEAGKLSPTQMMLVGALVALAVIGLASAITYSALRRRSAPSGSDALPPAQTETPASSELAPNDEVSDPEPTATPALVQRRLREDGWTCSVESRKTDDQAGILDYVFLQASKGSQSIHVSVYEMSDAAGAKRVESLYPSSPHDFVARHRRTTVQINDTFSKTPVTDAGALAKRLAAPPT